MATQKLSRQEQGLGMVGKRVFNPSQISPSFSLSRMERKANYLVIIDHDFDPESPYHYYPLRVDYGSGGRIRLVTFPSVLLPGIIMLKNRVFFRTTIDQLLRGVYDFNERIENPIAFLREVNGDTPDDSSEHNNEDADGTADGTAIATDSVTDVPDAEQESVLSYLQDPQTFRSF